MGKVPAIEVEKLRKAYTDGPFRRRRLEALRGVTFQVERGEIFGLLGPNGAGKTTFIKVLLGIVRSTGGAAMLMGSPAGSRAGRRQVGYLPEQLRVSRYHTANTAMEYYGRLSGMSGPAIRQRRAELLADVGLTERARDRVKKYSKGMLQRLGLAQALLHDPELLILDEPTDGLDPVGRSHVRTVLAGLRAAGKTVFLNSHILQEVELICDRVAILDKGELRFVGPVAEIVAQTSSHIELAIELTGDAQRLRQVFAGRQVLQWDVKSNQTISVKTRAENQGEVDHLIDQLRQEGASIVAVMLRRMTLEDAFLGLLQKPNRP